MRKEQSISYDEVHFFSLEESLLFVSLWNCRGKKSGLAHLHVPFHREHSESICGIGFHAILYWGRLCLAHHRSFFGCLYPVFSCLTCLHSCCACHRCTYGRGTPLAYYVSVTVILVVGKTHWNILWISIGNIFSLSFQQNKMTFVYMELDLWIFSDSSIWGIQLIWLNVLILRTIWNWHTDLDAGYLQRV